LTDLIAESEASLQDWIKLSARLAALQTEASGLSDSLAESKTLFASSEKSRKLERDSAIETIVLSEQRANRAEAGLRTWRAVGIGGISVSVLAGLLAWYGLTH
jgi:hypothetical protein